MNTFEKSLFDESISRRGLIRANISHRPSEEMDLDFSLTIALMRNHWLREEENTWKLLFCLYKDRLIAQKENLEIEDLPLVNSEKTIVEHLYLSEYYLIFRKLL